MDNAKQEASNKVSKGKGKKNSSKEKENGEEQIKDGGNNYNDNNKDNKDNKDDGNDDDDNDDDEDNGNDNEDKEDNDGDDDSQDIDEFALIAATKKLSLRSQSAAKSPPSQAKIAPTPKMTTPTLAKIAPTPKMTIPTLAKATLNTKARNSEYTRVADAQLSRPLFATPSFHFPSENYFSSPVAPRGPFAFVRSPLPNINMSSSSSSSTATLASLQESGAIGSLGNAVVVMLNFSFPDANRKVEAYKVDGITIQSHQHTAYMICMQIDQQDTNLYMAKVASGYPGLENRAIMIEGPWRPFWSQDTAQFISQFTNAELGKVTSLEMKKAISKS